MTNTEIKVGDLVCWVDRVECALGGDHTGLVVGAKVVDPRTGLDLPAHHRVYWVRWLNGPRRGDAPTTWCGKYLELAVRPEK